jgi:acyl-CoA thioesterase I
MNPAFLYFASGESLYAGSALFLLAVGISGYAGRGWLSLMKKLMLWLALALVIMASPPFHWSVDAIFFLAFAMWLAASNHWFRWRHKRSQRLSTAAFLSLLVALTGVEFSYRKMPTINGTSSDHLVVIGDSISSGIDPRVPAWTAVFQQVSGVLTKNLSKPGAQVSEGPSMAAQVTADDRVVLVELGGNDLLSGVSSDAFGRSLDSTLSKLATPGRTVVMFELPLLPHKVAYGRAQRRLAAKYGVWLIPKRYFAAVIASQNSTSDGLHLTATGASRMATLVECALSPVLHSHLD